MRLGLKVGPLKQGAKHGVTGFREHMPRRAVIALDQATNLHDLHRAREDPNGRVINIGRGAKQNHAFPRREAVRDTFRGQ